MNLRGKKILIVGFGVSGQAAARFLVKQGAKVAITDLRSKDKIGAFPEDLAKIEGYWGGNPEEIFRGRDLIVVSPGVPLHSPGLVLARKKKIPVIGEFGLAVQWIPKKAKFIAVTGTNGKSTTVTLIWEILLAARRKAVLAGNIGTPLLEVCMERRTPEWIVTEVSSYQLETTRAFHPRVSVILNITEDHLDRYETFQDYARAKFEIFRHQTSKDALIYKDDDPVVRAGVKKAKAQKLAFSLERSKSDRLWHSGGEILFQNGKVVETYSLKRVKLVGNHNIENMMAAIAATRFAGVAPKTIQKVLESFKGLAHRTEFIRTHLGVSYFDDSKGTNVDAVVKSLAGFPDRSVVLIAGGRDKGGSYEPLREMARRKVKCVIGIGEARQRIAKSLAETTEVVTVEGLAQAVSLAARKAQAGDVVLLSPACSSFDQFKDYKERGEMFQQLVREL